MNQVYLSVVLPVHNEEKNLFYLYRELKQELSLLGKKTEIIFVDDGSSDTSFDVLRRISDKDNSVYIVRLISNYGQSTALAAGIEHAKGENVVTMDSDLQHNPKDIKTLLEPLEKGFHVVCGWRKDRGGNDSFFGKALPSTLANLLVNKIAGLKLHDSIGGMKAFKREVTNVVSLYGDMHRYMPILAKWKGFKITEVPVQVRKRGSGKTHYTFTRIFKGLLDLLTVKFFVSYSTRPSHIFAKIGTLSFSIGFFAGIYYLIQKIFFGVHLLRDIASLILVVMLILLGVNFICFGFIADMISFDAIASKQRKMYVVNEVVGHERKPEATPERQKKETKNKS